MVAQKRPPLVGLTFWNSRNTKRASRLRLRKQGSEIPDFLCEQTLKRLERAPGRPTITYQKLGRRASTKAT
jgi:hypothetical protein